MTEPILQLALDLATRYREQVAKDPVFPRATVDDLRGALGGALPEIGKPAEQVLTDLVQAAEPGLVATTGPRYFGFVVGGSLPVTTATDWMVSTWDQNTGIYALSPAASVVEEVTAGWLRALFDLPEQTSVGFVTSGGTANFTCLAAARHAVLRQAGWDVEAKGLIGAPRVNLVISDQSHITVITGFRMLGLGSSVTRVAVDNQGRMIPAELAKVLAPLTGPTIVCAQVGNVNSGACDPIDEISVITRAKQAWLHVDGAFGLWARVSPARQALVKGLERADSWSVDAHKWLNVPYDSGLALCAHPEDHRAAMSLTAEYLQQTAGKERDNFDWVPEFSRRARGFTVYAAIRHLGREGIIALVEQCCARARQCADLLRRDPRVAILNEVVLNQVLVRFGDSDDLTKAVMKRVEQDGVCWMSGTTWHGKAAMRISVSNWSTSEQDIAMSAASVLRAAGA